MAAYPYITGSKRPWDAGSASIDQRDTESNSSTDVPMSKEDEIWKIEETKECIRNCLDSISSAADEAWAFGGHLDDAPNTGLTLSSSGVVGLPLSSHGADRIRAEAKQNTGPCVLGPDSFKLRNPAWNLYVRKLASRLLTGACSLQTRLVDLSLEAHSESIQSCP